jgi:hypothetical protein
VEYRNNFSDGFGEGLEKKMFFSDFIEKLQENNQNLYLTTQDLEYSPDEQPSIISAPLKYLKQDFPWVPKLFGNLIIANINLWLGATSRPSSSGLHHDYHDNLYILLRGEKKINLFSPIEAYNMYTYGEITKVHANGRINYVGEETRADGSNDKSEAAFLASKKLEIAAAKLIQVKYF